MLHILWMLIKFILIVLGILLGLVLLAILLLLFDPIRYRAELQKDAEGLGAVTAKARVSWLFGGIALHASFADGKPAIDIRIFGISIGKRKGLLSRRKKAPSPSAADSKEVSPEDKTAIPAAEAPSADEIPRAFLPAPQEEKPQSEKSPEADPLEAVPVEREAPPEEAPSEEAPSEEAPSEEAPSEEAPSARGLFSRIWGMLKTILGFPIRFIKFLLSLPGKIAAVIQKIAAVIRRIRAAIRGICEKISWWKDFLEDEHTRAALLLVRRQASGLIRHILPTKVSGDVTFGCEDPSLTGRILAVLGISFPLHKNCVNVTPLFDGENHLTGRVALKGRIYGIVVLLAVLKILINKNTRYVISRWKSKA